jgi:hypothetical protein
MSYKDLKTVTSKNFDDTLHFFLIGNNLKHQYLNINSYERTIRQSQRA